MKMEPGFVTSLKRELNRFGNIRDRLNAEGGLTDKQLLQLVTQPNQDNNVVIDNIDESDVTVEPGSDNQGLVALNDKEIAVIILAGGSGTRMGGPKALTKFSNDMSLLAFKLAQIHLTPALMMISPSIKDEIVDHVNSLVTTSYVSAFEQFESFRLEPDNRLKLDTSGNPMLYPRGTGDLATAMERSGVITALQESGIKHVVVSNVDNLGLPINVKALTHHIVSGAQVTCQVVRRLHADEGGIIAHVDGIKQVLDQFRLPDDFDIDGAKWTNTNTFIVTIETLKEAASLPSRYHRIRKVLPNGSMVVQYERLIHELTESFPTSFIEVDREHYYVPIKTRADLVRAQDRYFR